MSECSVTLDDSVSEEEEEGSFDELTDGTPYLQPGVEVSLLNEVRWAATVGGRAAVTLQRLQERSYSAAVVNTPHYNHTHRSRPATCG